MKQSAQVIALHTTTQAPGDNPLFGVALLKIAMELKKPGNLPIDEIVEGVLAQMHLPEEAFRDFLKVNGGLLRGIGARRRTKGVRNP